VKAHPITQCCLALAFMGAAACAATLEFKTPQGIALTVSADGLSSVRLGDHEIAAGGWRFSVGDWILNAGEGKVDAKEIREKSIEILAPTHARVRHVHPDVVATYDYVFAGEDATVRARIENNHPSEAIGAAWFSGLTLDFKRVPTGRMYAQHGSYLRAHGVGLCHPSFAVRIGGSYAVGDGFGVGLSPLGPTLERTLLWWDYTDWNQGKREALPTRRLSFLVAEPVPPLGARTFALRLRASTNTDWTHLLAPYKEHLLAVAGPVQYRADPRLFSQCCANKAVQYITPENPYGFHDGFRRLDLAEGVKAFCDAQIPELKKTRGQGVLFWGQGGENPRGAMYRPDFDILPPEVEANWPTLVARFKEAGLRVGVCARPGEIAYCIDRTRDGTLRIHPDDPAHIQMMVRRFKNMTDKGCTAFYLDTFGCSPEDVKAMRAYRKALGPDVPTFVEHACDAILPHSGLYTEIHFDKKAKAYGLAWMDLHTWEIFRWLVPGVGCVVKSRVNEKDLPEGFETPDQFLFRNHMSPLVDDWLLASHADALKALADEHLDETGQWRK